MLYLTKYHIAGDFYSTSLCPRSDCGGFFVASSVYIVALPQGRLFSAQQTGRSRDFVRLYAYGDEYKLVYYKTSVRLPGWEEKEHMFAENQGEDYEREACNISRARSKVLELALCNEWSYFVTLTLSAEKYDRYNLAAWQKDLSQWIRDQRKRVCRPELRYLLIPELHEDGAWHMHGLFEGIPDGDLCINEHGYLDWPRYVRKFGWISLSKVRSHARVSRYITKYIRKATESTAEALEAYANLYYHSRGLAGRQLVREGVLADGKAAPQWQYEDEHVKIMWMSKEAFADE